MQPVKIPFLHERQLRADAGYFDMIKNRFFPHFKVASVTSFLIILNIGLFIAYHVVYPSQKYDHFAEWPSQMDKWLLDIELIKSDKKYLYQIITSIFMHSNYLHLVGNMIFAIFVMYELEYCWKPAILWGLLGGVAAQCLAVVCLEGRFLGFSGVLCCYFGMFLGVIFAHCSYLQDTYSTRFWMIIIFVLFMAFMLIGFGTSALVHLFGFTFGILIGVAVYPRMHGSELGDTAEKVFKIACFGSMALVVVLAVLL